MPSKYENMTIEEQNKLLLSERSNNILDTTKLQLLYPNVKDIKSSICDICKKMILKNIRNNLT